MKSLDAALQTIEKKIFDNPEALAQLKLLENSHNEIDIALNTLRGLQEKFDEHADKMLDILELLQVKEYSLPNLFRCYERTYREVDLYDPRAFMVWLKLNLKPDEIMALVTPPTTARDLKRFCESWLNENPGKTIDGVYTEAKYIKLKTDYKGMKREPKKRKEYRSYRRKKPANS